MVFQADMAFTLELLALVAGSFLILIGNKESCCKNFYKAIGYFVIVMAVLSLLCTSYYSFRYWRTGAYQNPMPMMQGMSRGQGGPVIRGNQMMQMPMKPGDMHMNPPMQQKPPAPEQ